MEHREVAVVGGGPAGSAAAEQAAAGGSDTVVFEKGVPREDRATPGADSTDAAGMLDFWLDIMDFSIEEIPDSIIHRELDGAEFIGPSSRMELTQTGVDATYSNYGVTFHRTRMDDWLAQRARDAGGEIRTGQPVTDITTTLQGGPTHRLTLGDGSQLTCDKLVVADGPQRQLTLPAISQFLPDEVDTAGLAPPEANHIGYQEYRRFPEEVFEPSRLKFWWGHIPGETAYPWVFPNDGTVARVGLTMPIGLTMDDVDTPESYPLLEPDDDQLPTGGEYVRRLLEHEYGDEYDIDAEFPRVTDRGKAAGTETYPISSMRPIDSPVEANIAITGGAMGSTSVFHEGGYHTAVRTGKIAGRLAATDSMARYNSVWKRAVGWEIRRNVAFGDLVAGNTPAEWDTTFETVADLLAWKRGHSLLDMDLKAGLSGLRQFLAFKRRKFQYRNGGYLQLCADAYVY